jgi:hypothetical protein
MAMNPYCLGFEGLKRVLFQANATKNFDAVDQVEAELNRFALSITSDQRKMAAVQTDCPAIVAEIQERATSLGTPKTVIDPAHDPSIAQRWLTTLGDEQIEMLKTAIKTETARRAKAKKAKR